MFSRAMPLFETRRAVTADFQDAIRKLCGMFALHLLKSFADRFGNGLGHALARKPGQLPGEFVSLFVFDVQAHIGR